MTSPRHSELCESCRLIDFASYFQPPAQGEIGTKDGVGEMIYKRIELGVCSDIRNKSENCAFCYLITKATSLVSPKADISISSVFCGRTNTNSTDSYYIRVSSEFSGGRNTHNLQVLADDADSLGLSRDLLTRVPKFDRFDMHQACSWLNICLESHGSLCESLEGESDNGTSPLQPSNLLAIDLVGMCICRLPEGAEYMALSYCWPATEYLTLRKENREAMSIPGALDDNLGKLPGTVRDAIGCAKELPYRYLWIDALCIIQDDGDHKDYQLRQMDRVYGCASLTLVCAYPVARDTSDPCSGFPGYNKPDQARLRSVRTVKGLRIMIASPDIDDYLQQTRWYSRCWTFQEGLLSRRILYFTPIQVYFQCSSSVFCEDVCCESVTLDATVTPGNTLWNTKSRSAASNNPGNYGEWGLSRKPLGALSHMLLNYELALSAYTYRDVSYPADILKAFEGVKAVLSDAMQTDFWQGIPEKVLPQALCWQLRGPFRRKRYRKVGEPPSEPLFASWSWAGWDSSVNLNDHLAIQAYRTDAEWYIINDDSVATRLNVFPEWISLQSQRPAPSIIKAFLPNIVPRKDVDASSKEWRDARVLGCWTTCASFILDGTHHKLSTNNHEKLWRDSTNFAIKDIWGDTAGCILLPKTYFEDFGVDRLRCEFILISRSLPLPTKMSYFDESVYHVKEWCYLNVMLVSKVGEFSAIRVGVGVVHKDAWVAAKPETTFVKLL